MTPEQFCYWLQGFNEVAGAQPTPEQWVIIQDHLKEVFEKKTPDRLPFPFRDHGIAPVPMPTYPAPQLTPQSPQFPLNTVIC